MTVPMNVRKALSNLPVIGAVAKRRDRNVVIRQPDIQFQSTAQYWNDRYTVGGNSGAGSYGRLARFKADVINDFVAVHGVETVIEYGCGDGAQLALARYPSYVGIDISQQAVALCRQTFHGDERKIFFHTSSPQAQATRADLAMSLDVIYHLVEDRTYEAYMSRLVAASKKYLCIYSSNDERPGHVSHVRHRCFTDWLSVNAPHWSLISRVPNRYPKDPHSPNDTSWADLYFLELKPGN
jgi:SAM-dependent methyltransferase